MFRSKSEVGLYTLDSSVALDINGTRQRIRLCGARAGLPPVLVVQAGPGLPLLNEAGKFQERLRLEDDFAVAYWDQRGCGNAALRDTKGVSLETQIDDTCAVVRWLAERTGQKVVVLGISIGATTALQAAVREARLIKALVAVSIDIDTSASDVAASAFLEQAARAGRVRVGSIEKLGVPPYTIPAPIQLRARLLADLGGIEHGKRFAELLRGFFKSLVGTYGLLGALAALRNMNAIQKRLLPEAAGLNLLRNWPRPAAPVHYLFGAGDPLVPESLVQDLSSRIKLGDTITRLPDTGHMVHFDRPAIVRSIVARAHSMA